MNHEEASDLYVHLRRAVEETKQCLRMAEKSRIAPIASLNTVLELLIGCEIAWRKMLKKHEYDQELDL